MGASEAIEIAIFASGEFSSSSDKSLGFGPSAFAISYG